MCEACAAVLRADPQCEPSAVEAWASEEVLLGGEPMTTAEAIRQLRADGHPDRLIDRWVQGAHLANRSRREP